MAEIPITPVVAVQFFVKSRANVGSMFGFVSYTIMSEGISIKSQVSFVLNLKNPIGLMSI